MDLVKKLFSLHFYTSVLKGSQKYRVFLAIFLLSVVLSIKPVYFIFKDVYPAVQNLESKAMALVDEAYPQELEIMIKKGLVSTNVTEPYYLTIRQETLDHLFSSKKPAVSTQPKLKLLAIDTKGKAEDFDQYQSAALLTESSVVYYRDKNLNIYSLKEIEDMTITKDSVKTQIREINKDNKIGNFLTIGIILSPLVIVLGIFILHIIVFLFLSLWVYIMVRIFKIPHGFKDTFRYTAAIAFIVTLTWNILLFIPFVDAVTAPLQSMATIVILGIAYNGIYQLKKHRGDQSA